MKRLRAFTLALAAMSVAALPAFGLSLAPEEFNASRQLACVLAEQSLGRLSAEEYGARTHEVLDDFDEHERDNILAKALGYYDGLMFAIADGDRQALEARLESFVASGTCGGDYRNVTFSL